MPEKPAKRKCVEIKASVKKIICQEKVRNPKMSQNDLVILILTQNGGHFGFDNPTDLIIRHIGSETEGVGLLRQDCK